MALGTVVTTLLPFIDKWLTRIIPDEEARAKAKQELTLELLQLEADQSKAQVELNKEEARSGHLFVAGWRPFIGWIGGLAIAWTYLMEPMLSWIVTVLGYTGTFPDLDTAPLMALVLAMLGVGGMRTLDKYLGTDTKKINIVPKQTHKLND